MSDSSLDNLFQMAIGHHQAGRLDEAEDLYRRILSQSPNHAGALHLLGAVAHQKGRTEAAIEFMKRSLEINPSDFGAWHNLGEVYRKTKQHAQAEGCYLRALNVKEDFAQAHEHLGMTLMEMGRYEEAAAASARAAQLSPHNANLWFDVGLARQKQGKQIESQAAYRRALELNPKHALASNNLGMLLLERGESAAKEHLIRAIEIDANYTDAWNNLGLYFRKNDRHDLAMKHFQKAVELNPSHLDALNNLGLSLRMMGRHEDSKKLFERILSIDPGFSEARVNLGMSCFFLHEMEESEKQYRILLEANPAHAVATAMLGYILYLQHRFDEAQEYYLKALKIEITAETLMNWGILLSDAGEPREALESMRRSLGMNSKGAAAYSNYLYSLYLDPNLTATALLEEHRIWRENFADGLKRKIDFANPRDPARRLKVGFVSADFRDHIAMRYVLPLLRELDASKFEAFCYSDAVLEDEFTNKCKEQAPHWTPSAGLTDNALADQILSDGIDILVDLSCHTAGNRMLLFAMKPAPVQVSWVGYPGTTGLQTMDYRLSDPWIDPPGEHDGEYVEKTYRLNSYWCYDPMGCTESINDSPAAVNGYATFGCLCQTGKVNDEVARTWKEILSRTPGSKLIVLGRSRRARDRILRAMGDLGQRVEFVNQTDRGEYLRRYHSIDVVLDTYPYNGPSTAMDALWMGVPVVTRSGPLGVGRGTRSVLGIVGLSQWAAQTREQYIDLSVKLASDIATLSSLRHELRGRIQKSALMDIPKFARDMEKAFGWMWRQWALGNGKSGG